jgi:secondary thiamine-phosphate synthase enzyme
MIRYLEVKSKTRTELIDITSEIAETVRNVDVRNGVCHLFALHTTAGITINEGADPAVRSDISRFLEKLVPNAPWFTHSEGNSDSHIKSTLVGASQTIFIENGRLLLGTWQSIFFCEFDGPRTRKVAVKITADS